MAGPALTCAGGQEEMHYWLPKDLQDPQIFASSELREGPFDSSLKVTHTTHSYEQTLKFLPSLEKNLCETRFLCVAPGCPGTHSVEQAGLELTEIHPPLLEKTLTVTKISLFLLK